MGTINILSASCERQALDLNEKAVFLNSRFLNFLLKQIVDILNVMFNIFKLRNTAFSLRSRAWRSQDAEKMFIVPILTTLLGELVHRE
jgi:hypothetical protein